MTNSIDETKNLLSTFIKDPELEGLEIQLRHPNIFSVLKFENTEIRHSNFISWLLDPNGNHGLGDLFLKRFLKDIFSNQKYDWINEFAIDSLDLDDTEVKREWHNIDLLIQCKGFIVCIENKLFAGEHSDQLKKYHETVDTYYKDYKKAFIYLTPYGIEPEKEEDAKLWRTYSYDDIARNIETIMSLYSKDLADKVKGYLEDYLIAIRRDIMKESELNELARTIYRSHKEAIDFIKDNIPDRLEEVLSVFEKKIIESGWVLGSKNKGYARFLTPKLNKIVPRKGTGWRDKESFIFEIYFWPKVIKFQTVISPGEEGPRKIINDAISKAKGAKTPRGADWLVHFILKWPIDVTDEALTNNDIKKKLDDIWPKITEVVLSVEKEILLRENDLIKS